MVVENILDGRPMEGVTCPELLEYSLRLLDATLDGGLVERISEWTPVINPAISYTLDSRPMEGITNLEHSARLRRGRRVGNHWSSRFLVRR